MHNTQIYSLSSSGKGRVAVTCGMIAVLLLLLLFSGLFITDEQLAADFSRKSLPPCWEYPFGTDWLGRNLLLRTGKGMSISIFIGMIASVVSALIATLVGTAAAMGARWLDSFIGWLIDLTMGVPHLILLILISFACGKGMKGLLAGIALTHWTGLARIIRAEALQLRQRQYIAVSRRLGHGSGWILRHHVLPQIFPQFLVGLILMFPHAILHESSLSFLGFGLSPEQPAIGIMLAESMQYLTGGLWWPAVFPGLALILTVFLIDRLGEQLRQLSNPATAQE